MTQTCQVPNCTVQVPPHYVMCRPHWRMVSPYLRRLVRKHMREGETGAAWREAVGSAVRSVEMAHGDCQSIHDR